MLRTRLWQPTWFRLPKLAVLFRWRSLLFESVPWVGQLSRHLGRYPQGHPQGDRQGGRHQRLRQGRKGVKRGRI